MQVIILYIMTKIEMKVRVAATIMVMAGGIGGHGRYSGRDMVVLPIVGCGGWSVEVAVVAESGGDLW